MVKILFKNLLKKIYKKFIFRFKKKTFRSDVKQALSNIETIHQDIK